MSANPATPSGTPATAYSSSRQARGGTARRARCPRRRRPGAARPLRMAASQPALARGPTLLLMSPVSPLGVAPGEQHASGCHRHRRVEREHPQARPGPERRVAGCMPALVADSESETMVIGA